MGEWSQSRNKKPTATTIRRSETERKNHGTMVRVNMPWKESVFNQSVSKHG